MSNNRKTNDYLVKINNWYDENRYEDVDWKTLFEMLYEERSLIEANYDEEIEKAYDNFEDQAMINKLHMRKTLDSFVYKKEELFAYANHMQNVIGAYYKLTKNQSMQNASDIEFSRYFTNKVNIMCEKTYVLLKEKTKTAKKILFIAASMDMDGEKIYSHDKYDKLEESINILEDAIHDKTPQMKDIFLPLVIKSVKFDPNDFISDTDDNAIVKFMGDFIETKKQIDENIEKMRRAIEERNNRLEEKNNNLRLDYNSTDSKKVG